MSCIVEKGIPLPKDYKTKKRIYPFDKLEEVGDSFVTEEYSLEILHSITSSGNYYSKCNGGTLKFSCRKTEDDKIRCWRVK